MTLKEKVYLALVFKSEVDKNDALKNILSYLIQAIHQQ